MRPPSGCLLPIGAKPKDWKRPSGFVHDQMESCLGVGDEVFAAAKHAFQRWTQFDLGWARVTDPQTANQTGEFVGVEVMSLGLWSLNLSCIGDTVDTPDRFGFVYSTTTLHVEQGEEKFLLRFDRTSGNGSEENGMGEVWYELEAVSRPRNAFARIGYPVTRAFQRRFARDSHRRMRNAVSEGRALGRSELTD